MRTYDLCAAFRFTVTVRSKTSVLPDLFQSFHSPDVSMDVSGKARRKMGPLSWALSRHSSASTYLDKVGQSARRTRMAERTGIIMRDGKGSLSSADLSSESAKVEYTLHAPMMTSPQKW